MYIYISAGYGHISPATSGGRVFCSIFALIGIPLFLITVGGLGEKLRKLTQKIQDKATCKSLEHKPKAVKGLTTLLVLLIGFILFVVIPACIFLAIESWAYREAMYYVFITLTTIGFGDYVPGNRSIVQNLRWSMKTIPRAAPILHVPHQNYT